MANTEFVCLNSYISNNVHQILLSDLNSNCDIKLNDNNKILNESDQISLNLENINNNPTLLSENENIEQYLFFNKSSNNNNNNNNDKPILEFFKINSIKIRKASNLLITKYYDKSATQPLLLNDSYNWFDELNLDNIIPNVSLFKSTLIKLREKIKFGNCDGDGDIILEYSIILSTLERILGDIIYFKLIVVDLKQPIFGRMLRDILDDDTLLSVLGLPLVYLLKILVGPPIGLNLRNVTWHGFISPKEFDLSLLLYIIHLIFTISIKFKNYKASSTSPTTPSRPVTNLKNKFANYIESDSNGYGSYHLQLVKYKKEIFQILENSYFIVPGRLEIWKNAFNFYFNTGREDSESIFNCFVLLIPQLEHSLRLNFVKLNDLPNKFLVADYVSFYTTLDLFISKTLQLSTCVLNSNGDNGSDSGTYSEDKHLQIPTSNKNYSKYENPKYYKFNTNTNESLQSEEVKEEEKEILFNNQLVVSIGDSLISMLLDLLIYNDGPKIRDKLSHFEIEPLGIPITFLNQLIILALLLCKRMEKETTTTSTTDAQLYGILDNYEKEYESQFHTCKISISRLSTLIGSNEKLVNFYSNIINGNSKDEDETLSEYIGERMYKPIIGNEDTIKMEQVLEYIQNSNDKDNYTTSLSLDEINLFPNKNQLDVYNSIRKSIKIVTESILEYNNIGLSLFDKVINENTTTKRTQNSFYKWIGCTNSFLTLNNLIIVQLKQFIYNNLQQVNNNITEIEKIQHLFEKLITKIKLSEFDNVVKLVYLYFAKIKNR